MKRYKLEKYGNLYYTTGAVKGKAGVVALELLVDTGSTYTILPWEAIEKIQAGHVSPPERVKLITPSGYIYAPRVAVDWIHSLGLRFENFLVVIHTLPPGMYVKGILGMDFLTKAQARIDVTNGEITVMD